jgi:serine/threonine-protein kinase HipA
MDSILKEVISAVKDWKSIAKQIGISNKEQQLMELAFNTEI